MESQARRAYGYRSEYRSEYRPARTHYRRNAQEEKEEKKDFREIILMQCIMCGVILAAVLIVCLINIPSVRDLRYNIKMAISENLTAEEFSGSISNMVGYFGSAKEYVYRIFDSEEDPIGGNGENKGLAPSDSGEVGELENPAGDFRIDEEILQEINERNKQEEELQKKRQVPLT